MAPKCTYPGAPDDVPRQRGPEESDSEKKQESEKDRDNEREIKRH